MDAEAPIEMEQPGREEGPSTDVQGMTPPAAAATAADSAGGGVAPTPSTDVQTVLQEAEAIVNGKRADDYGDCLASFSRIAQLWSAILGIEIAPDEVALCMIGLKISRATNGFHRDSIVDIAGYAACLEKIQLGRERQRVMVA